MGCGPTSLIYIMTKTSEVGTRDEGGDRFSFSDRSLTTNSKGNDNNV